jgi:hypothetical protein
VLGGSCACFLATCTGELPKAAASSSSADIDLAISRSPFLAALAGRLPGVPPPPSLSAPASASGDAPPVAREEVRGMAHALPPRVGNPHSQDSQDSQDLGGSLRGPARPWEPHLSRLPFPRLPRFPRPRGSLSPPRSWELTGPGPLPKTFRDKLPGGSWESWDSWESGRVPKTSAGP